MYNVVYRHKKQIIQRFKELFRGTNVQKKWNNATKTNPYVAGSLPRGVTAEMLLTAPFPTLVDVYAHFKDYLDTLPSDTENENLKSTLAKLFNYNSASAKIHNFFVDMMNGLSIHHCYYCDLNDISSYTDHQGKRHNQFDIEHVLDKGACPLVALSLFNFVPSCSHCNQDLKGTKLIGGTIETAKRLSPTTNGYDFYHKVKFVVTPKPNAHSLEVDKKYVDDYEVDFVFKNNIYSYVVDIFNLKERYNQNQAKGVAIDVMDTIRRNPPAHIQALADLEHVSYDEKFEEIFKMKYYRDNHYSMMKMREDLIRALTQK